jgi:hypothetical protein
MQVSMSHAFIVKSDREENTVLQYHEFNDHYKLEPIGNLTDK